MNHLLLFMYIEYVYITAVYFHFFYALAAANSFLLLTALALFNLTNLLRASL